MDGWDAWDSRCAHQVRFLGHTMWEWSLVEKWSGVTVEGLKSRKHNHCFHRVCFEHRNLEFQFMATRLYVMPFLPLFKRDLFFVDSQVRSETGM